MNFRKVIYLIIITFIVFFSSCSFGTSDLNSLSRFMIPDGAVIISAELHLYSTYTSNEGLTVDVYSVNSPWEETTVTWNSHNDSYDPAVLSATQISSGWHIFDIKPFIEQWMSGQIDTNYGLMLDQRDLSGVTYYASKDNSDPSIRPFVQMTYLIEGNILADEPETLTADAYIWPADPDYTGNNSTLYTGYIGRYEKKTLILFDLEMEEPGDLVGTGTPGYWKNHPEAWPVETIEIGGISYTIEEAIDQMLMPVKKDKWYTMFRALVAAKLNVLNGANDDPIADTITAADDWMNLYHHLVDGKLVIIAAKSDAWKEGEEYYKLLDAYNNGLLEGAPSRDTLE